MADSLEELEREAAERSRRGTGRGRDAGQSRNPRKTGSDDEAAKRRQALEDRQRERDRRRERDADRPEPPPAPEVEVETPPEPDTSGEGNEERSGRRRAKRPKSIPFYPNPEHDAFLWRVIEAGSARQMRIPATAVLRLALTRLEEQMTPSEIVRAVGDSVQPDGKMGRPRL